MVKLRRREPESIGQRFGKRDLDRVGFFHDPSLAPFGSYTGTPVKFRQGIEKGRQMHPGPPTPLFEEKFVRIFNGEALNEPLRIEARDRLAREKEKLGGRLLPPSPAQKHATPGDYYGCFEKISSFNPAVKDQKKRDPELPNVKIKPNPRGGPGYADICLSPFPTYSYEPYDQETRPKGKPVGRFLCASTSLDFFPPNPYEALHTGPMYAPPEEIKVTMIPPGRIYVPFPKRPGGNHSGCFNKYPSYSSDPYIKDAPEKKKESGRFMLGTPNLRSKYTNSIINHVTAISCNTQNYNNYRPRVYALEK